MLNFFLSNKGEIPIYLGILVLACGFGVQVGFGAFLVALGIGLTVGGLFLKLMEL